MENEPKTGDAILFQRDAAAREEFLKHLTPERRKDFENLSGAEQRFQIENFAKLSPEQRQELETLGNQQDSGLNRLATCKPPGK